MSYREGRVNRGRDRNLELKRCSTETVGKLITIFHFFRWVLSCTPIPPFESRVSEEPKEDFGSPLPAAVVVGSREWKDEFVGFVVPGLLPFFRPPE